MVQQFKPYAHNTNNTVTLIVAGYPVQSLAYRYKGQLKQIKEKWDKLYRLKDRSDVEYELIVRNITFRTK